MVEAVTIARKAKQWVILLCIGACHRRLDTDDWRLADVQGGFTHGFVCEFTSAEDRDYYVAEDPTHQDFVKTLDGKVADVQVFDFEPGKF